MSFGVIFDLDGVLVDTSECHYQSWLALGREYGFTMSRDFFLETFGQRNVTIIPHLVSQTLSPEEIHQLSERKEELYRQICRGQLQPLPGALQLVRSLSEAGFKLAIGSSTARANIDLVLEELELKPFFQTIVSAEEVRRGKPDPEVFLKAAARMGVPPSKCVVIEDAPAGIEAGKRAGMRTIAVTTTHPRERFEGIADKVVKSLEFLTIEDLIQLIEQGLILERESD